MGNDLDYIGGPLASFLPDSTTLNNSNAYGYISVQSNNINASCLGSELPCVQVSSVLYSAFFVSTTASAATYTREVKLGNQLDTSAYEAPRSATKIELSCEDDGDELSATCTAEMTWGYAVSEDYTCDEAGKWSVTCPVYKMVGECHGASSAETCVLVERNDSITICECESPFEPDDSKMFAEDDGSNGYSVLVARGVTSFSLVSEKNSSLATTFTSEGVKPSSTDDSGLSVNDTVSIAVPVGVFFIFMLVLVGFLWVSRRRGDEAVDAWKAVNNGMVDNRARGAKKIVSEPDDDNLITRRTSYDLDLVRSDSVGPMTLGTESPAKTTRRPAPVVSSGPASRLSASRAAKKAESSSSDDEDSVAEYDEKDESPLAGAVALHPSQQRGGQHVLGLDEYSDDDDMLVVKVRDDADEDML